MSKPQSFMLFMSSLGLLMLLYACTTPKPTNLVKPEPTIVEIDKAAHFLTPAEEDVVVLPGAYEIYAEKGGLRLIAEEGTADESILINANATDHQESVTTPMALSLSDNEDDYIITLLLPKGQRLEARGSQSGVHSRASQRSRVPHSKISRHLAMRKQATSLLPKLTLSSASVKYSGSKKSYQGKKIKTTWQLPVNDTHDSGTFTFTWAGYWEKTALQPSFIPSKVVDLQNLVKKKQCCIKLTVNGKEAQISRLTFGKGGTLLTRVTLSNVRAKTWPKNVQVVVTKGKKTWESAATKVYAKPMSYYTSVLHPIFSHDRCTTCHSLGDHEAIVEMHQYRLGIDNYPYEEDAEARPHNPSFCGTCHSAPNLQNEWFSPFAAQDINWKDWNASRVCHKVTGPFKNKDGVIEAPFDHDRFDHHFHEDPRILWAVSDGMTPLGNDLDVPVPDNVNAWFRKVDPWVDAGTPCPSKSKFFLRSKTPSQRKFFPRR